MYRLKGSQLPDDQIALAFNCNVQEQRASTSMHDVIDEYAS